MEIKCCTCGKLFEDDEIIYAPKRKAYHYFCFECYKKRKGYTDKKFNEYLESTKERINNKKMEKDLYSYLSLTYGYLDTRFFKKKNDINKGLFKTKQYASEYSSFKINDKELLDMFKKMEQYLKNATSNLKDKTQVLHYVIAIVYNSYPKYIEHKKKMADIVPEKQIEEISEIKIQKAMLPKENNDTINLNEFVL